MFGKGKIIAIIIDQEQKLLTPHTITLHTKNTTYQMAVGAYGQLLHLYYGPRLDGDMRYLLTYYDRGFSGNPYEAECDKTVHIEKSASAVLDFMNGEFDVIHFHGRHGMERIFERTSVEHGNQVFGSRRGASSHQQNPFVMLAGKQTGEDAGECYGCMLLYSGNFKAEAEKDQYEQTRLVMGLSDEMFSWRLELGETFDTPEAVLSYSADGFSALSWNLHRLIRSHICRSAYRDTKRPVLINNWEATYFDFTGLRLSEQRQMVQTDSTSMKHRTQLNRITSQEHSLYMQACQSHAWTTSTVHGRCI